MVFRGWKIKACLAGLLKAFCVVEHTLNTLKPLRNTHICATHRPRYWVDLWLLWRITDTCLSSGPRFHSGCLTLRSPRKELRNAAKPRPGIRVSCTSRDSSASNPTTAKARRRLGSWTLMTYLYVGPLGSPDWLKETPRALVWRWIDESIQFNGASFAWQKGTVPKRCKVSLLH